MAFVKVVRRGMLPQEWAHLRYGWIKRGIIKKKYEITELEIKDALQTGENTYEELTPYRPLKRGDLYFSPDGTVFIRGRGVVPMSLRNEKAKAWFYLQTAAEMIVKINGHYAGGLDPNRDRILLGPWLEAGKWEFTFEIEGYNRSKPDDERNLDTMDLRGCRQIFEGAYVAELEEGLLSLYYDLTLLLDIADCENFHEEYRKMVIRELNHALDLVDYDSFAGAEEASAYIEEHIYRNRNFGGTGTVALVGHSHLDIAYYWRRIHAVQKNARTILIQMRLMDRYPDFKYAHTQPYVYELLEKYYPELFAELKEKIKQGSFEPVGAMYVEPDCNIPAAESLIRQCLYGQHYYRKAFGITVDNAWLPDVFGNSWILPQILKKSGVEYFVSNKMSTWNDTNRFPHNHFLWKGIDGSEVYACVPPTHFITWNMPSQIQENWEAYQEKETGGQTLSMFGYGDGGSGATEEMLELMARFDKLSVMPKTQHMGADEFLHRNLKDNQKLETWDGELYLEMHRGTFTTKSDLKAYNRRLEFMLRDTELLSLLRMRQGKDYPQEELNRCYKMLLLNQFHDILPGSHIHPVYEDAMKDYCRLEEHLQALLSQEGDSYFNTLNWKREGILFFPNEKGGFVRKGERGYFDMPDRGARSGGEPGSVLEGDGGREADASWLGISWSKTCQKETSIREHAWREGASLCVETPFYRIRFGEDGSIESLYDKRMEREWAAGGFNKLHLYQDMPGIYDAWDILPGYKDVEFPFTVEKALHLTFADGQAAQFTALLGTPEGRSAWRVILRLFKEDPGIEVEHVVDWNEKHRLVKAEFTCNVLSRELMCDTSAGYIRRETHKNTSWQKARYEVCHHKWCDFGEKDGGIAVINEGKYGLGVEEKGFSLSLLRSTIRPDILSDLGHHDFCYLILPHKKDAVEAGINRRAFEYNVPLVRTPEKGLGFDFAPLYLQAAKLSEDRKFVVFRLSEQDGLRGKMKLPFRAVLMNMLEDVQGEAQEIAYGPFEILTVGMRVEDFLAGEASAEPCSGWIKEKRAVGV